MWGQAARAVTAGFLALATVLGGGCIQGEDPAPPSSQRPAADAKPGACPEAGPTVAFEETRIVEASGISRSQRNPCLFWVHNDSGSGPTVHASDGAGRNLGALTLPAQAIDWEGAAGFTRDGVPYLLVADVGNNGRDRSTVQIHVFEEPDVAGLPRPFNITVADVQTVAIQFAGAPFDCESVAVDPTSDEILFVSKGMPTNLPEDPSGPNQALYTIPLTDSLARGEATFVLQTPLAGVWPWPEGAPVSGSGADIYGRPMTAMDLAPDATSVVVLSYRDALVFERTSSQTLAEAMRGTPRVIAVPLEGRDQMEGVAYSADGSLLLITDERGLANSELTVVPFAG